MFTRVSRPLSKKVFNDDGSPAHVRGNMKAVIKAILTDYEARSPALVDEPGYGRCREPLIRLVNLLRSGGGGSDGTADEET